MKRICAWCGKDQGTNDIGNPEETTHGICKECQAMIREDMKNIPKEPALEPMDTYDLIEH